MKHYEAALALDAKLRELGIPIEGVEAPSEKYPGGVVSFLNTATDEQVQQGAATLIGWDWDADYSAKTDAKEAIGLVQDPEGPMLQIAIISVQSLMTYLAEVHDFLEGLHRWADTGGTETLPPLVRPPRDFQQLMGDLEKALTKIKDST